MVRKSKQAPTDTSVWTGCLAWLVMPSLYAYQSLLNAHNLCFMGYFELVSIWQASTAVKTRYDFMTYCCNQLTDKWLTADYNNILNSSVTTIIYWYCLCNFSLNFTYIMVKYEKYYMKSGINLKII